MKFYNTLTRSDDLFSQPTDAPVKLYTCGLTVYSQPHIGNWVAYIYWDILVRTLRDAGYSIDRVQNITDVGHLTSDQDSGEDKMEKGARLANSTAWDVATTYIKIADHEAYKLLGLLRPDHMPRATEYIPQQIAFVKQLEANGYTYVIPEDGVYLDTSKVPDYGKLARLDIDGLQMGARVHNANKRNSTDFAVWKLSPINQTRDMQWESPWGTGFPGWHLECSVMARELLGDHIDIHTGGIDHIPVHHTNEIAQTESLTKQPFSTFWIHNNHLKVDGEKMSKSLGNILTLQDIIDKGFDVEAFKLTILAKHYRTEGNFTWEILEATQNRLNGYRAMADQQWQVHANGSVTDETIQETKKAMRSALQNDLGTPQALAALSQLSSAIDSGGISTNSQGAFVQFLEWVDSILGLTLSHRQDITAAQRIMLGERHEARIGRDWTIADTVRDQLLTDGIAVSDTAYGQIWTRI